MAMKKIYFTLIFTLLRSFIFAQAPIWEWAKSAGGPGDETANSVTTDAAGNVIVAGEFNSLNISIGTTLIQNAGGKDMFVTKYDPSGNVLWVKSAGGVSYDRASSVTTDLSQNVIVTGIFQSPAITFGTNTLVNNSSDYSFIVKYDLSGNVLWAKNFGGMTSSIVTDTGGNVIVTGYFSNPTITIGSTVLVNTNTGYREVFIAKFDPLGNEIWAKSASGTDSDEAHSITSDDSGNLIIVGEFSSPSITFDNTTLPDPMPGFENMFIVKYDTYGNVIWAKSTGANNDVEVADCVTVDSLGNIIVGGWFASSTLTLDSIVLTGGAGQNVFIVKYDPSGNVLWAKSTSGNYNYAFATSVTSDILGNLLLVGVFLGPAVAFETVTLTNVYAYVADIFIVKYDPLGTMLWAKSEGSISDDYAWSVTDDAMGNIVVAGYFNSISLNFGTDTLVNSGNDDMVIAKLGSFPVGNDEIANDLFSIHPNPTNGEFTISLPTDDAEIIVADMLGQEIIKTRAIQNTINLQIENNGVYIVYVKTKCGTSGKKLIVNR